MTDPTREELGDLLRRLVDTAVQMKDRAERAEAQLATAREGFKDVLGMLDDPTGGEHERDMRGASIIARKHLALLDHPAPAPSEEAVARAALEWAADQAPTWAHAQFLRTRVVHPDTIADIIAKAQDGQS
jgi:hypothetical protein